MSGWRWIGQLPGKEEEGPFEVAPRKVLAEPRPTSRVRAAVAALRWCREHKAERPRTWLLGPDGERVPIAPRAGYTETQKARRATLFRKKHRLTVSLAVAKVYAAPSKHVLPVTGDWKRLRDAAMSASEAELAKVVAELTAMRPGVDDPPPPEQVGLL